MRAFWVLLTLLLPACSAQGVFRDCHEEGNLAACQRLWFETGDVSSGLQLARSYVKQSQKDGLSYPASQIYERACDGGSLEACLSWVQLLDESGTRSDAQGQPFQPSQTLLKRRRGALQRACELAPKTDQRLELAEDRYGRSRYSKTSLPPVGALESTRTSSCRQLAASWLGIDADKTRAALEAACVGQPHMTDCQLQMEEWRLIAEPLLQACLINSHEEPDLTSMKACQWLGLMVDAPRGRWMRWRYCTANGPLACERAYGDPDPLSRPLTPLAPPVRELPQAVDTHAGAVKLVYPDNKPENMYLQGGLDWFRVHVILKKALPGFSRCYQRGLDALRNKNNKNNNNNARSAAGSAARRERLSPHVQQQARGVGLLELGIDTRGELETFAVRGGKVPERTASCMRKLAEGLRFESSHSETRVWQNFELVPPSVTSPLYKK